MRDLADGGGVFDVAEVVWLLDVDACGVGVNGSFDPFDIGQAVCRWWNNDDFHVVPKGVGLDRREHIWIDRAADDGFLLLSAIAHGQCFSSCAGAIVNRRVGNIHTGELADVGLVFEDGLQDPLADLSLVRGVSGLEIFFGKHALDHCWNVMVVRAGATEDVWEDLILFRDRCDDAAGFKLALTFWQVERCFQLHIFRDDAEHVVKRFVAAGLEHLLTFFVGIRHIAAHRVSPSFSFYEERFRLLIIRGLRGRFCIRLRSSDRRLLQNR